MQTATLLDLQTSGLALVLGSVKKSPFFFEFSFFYSRPFTDKLRTCHLDQP